MGIRGPWVRKNIVVQFLENLSAHEGKLVFNYKTISTKFWIRVMRIPLLVCLPKNAFMDDRLWPLQRPFTRPSEKSLRIREIEDISISKRHRFPSPIPRRQVYSLWTKCDSCAVFGQNRCLIRTTSKQLKTRLSVISAGTGISLLVELVQQKKLLLVKIQQLSDDASSLTKLSCKNHCNRLVFFKGHISSGLYGNYLHKSNVGFVMSVFHPLNMFQPWLTTCVVLENFSLSLLLDFCLPPKLLSLQFDSLTNKFCEFLIMK